LEKNPIDGELDSVLMVGNIESVEALRLVDLMRAEIRIEDLPSGIVPVPFAGMVLKVRFVDGRSWDLLISFTNPQTIEVS
jgi:hypothetical protein